MPEEGHHHWYQLTATARDFDGQRCVIVMHTDVTSLQRDALTGLANRVVFEARLAHNIAIARRRHTSTGCLLLDLDGFKPINARHGHLVGDTVLLAVAARLQTEAGNDHLVARLGGDEFALLSSAPATSGDLVTFAERLCASLAEPFPLPSGEPAEIGASIGVAVFPNHGSDQASLLATADEALYAAKRAGRNRVLLATTHDRFRGGDARAIALDRIAS